jgi:hypothetical protein
MASATGKQKLTSLKIYDLRRGMDLGGCVLGGNRSAIFNAVRSLLFSIGVSSIPFVALLNSSLFYIQTKFNNGAGSSNAFQREL